MIWYDIYLTAIGLTPGGSITRHIYNKQYTQYIETFLHFIVVYYHNGMSEVKIMLITS